MLKKIFLNKLVSKLLIKMVLRSHGFFYKLAAVFATILDGKLHPKHDIIRYEDWFKSHLDGHDIVIDIGSNTGHMVNQLSQKVQYIYGIEINEKKANQALLSMKNSNIEFICSDATKYNYDGLKDITVVTLSNVLEHIEYRVDFLKKIVMKVPWNSNYPKKILIRVPMIDRDWITVYKKQIGVEYRLDKTHFTEYTYLQFKDELSQSNIDIASYEVKFGELYAVCSARY